MVAILVCIVIICAVFYFLVFSVFKPGFIDQRAVMRSFKKLMMKKSSTGKVDPEDTSDIITITGIKISDENQKIFYGMYDPVSNDFEIKDNLEAGRKYKFEMSIKNISGNGS